MRTQTLTIERLFAEYAETIADEAGLELDDYEQTASGLAALLHDTATNSTAPDTISELLKEATAGIEAVARLGDDSPKTRELLARIDAALYEAKSDIEQG